MENSKNLFDIAVFGGTQGVGKHCITKALSQGHKIITLARNESKLSDISHKNLKIIQGDVESQEKVDEVIKNCDLVLNSLGGWNDVCSKGTAIIINSMKKYGIKRIITCTSLGVGDSYKDCSLFTKAFIWAVISKPIADKNIQEQYLFESGLDYIIVRPTGLVDKPANGNYITQGVSGGTIPRADVAGFMLKQIYSDEYLKRAVSLASV